MNRRILSLWLISGIFLLAHCAFSQGTAFSYQGQLDNGGAPATGYYDFKFALYNAPSNGIPASNPITNNAVSVSNGLFTTTLDFGPGVFTGTNLWLDIGVCPTNNGTNFTMLSPLQPVLPVPYAIFANTASNLLGSLSSTQLSGTLPASAFAGYTNTVAFTNSGNVFAGNGGGLTNVNVTNLTGVLVDSQLPTNTAYLNSNQTFTGANVFTNLYGNSFSGSFYGNGLVGWVVVSGTSVQAQIDHGYLLTNSQIVTVTLPTTANVGDVVRVACAGATGWQLAQNAGQSVVGNFLRYGTLWQKSGAAEASFTGIASSANGSTMVASYAGASSGYGIYLSTSSGASWASSGASGSIQWQAVASSANGSRLVAAGTGYPIYTLTNSGSSWTANNSLSLDWTGVASSSSGNNLVAVAAGTSGGIYTNSGTTWALAYSTGANDWTSVASSPSGVYLIAAESSGGIYASVNGGVSWAKVNPNTYSWDSVGISADGNYMVAAVSGGAVYLSSNGGTSWSQPSGLPTSASWSSVACSSDGSKLIAVVNGGYSYTSGNWGTTWQTNAITANWSGATVAPDGNVVAAAINYYASSPTVPTGIYTSDAASQTTTTTGTSGYILGAQGSAAELIYIGNNQFMPASFSGTIWGN